METNKRTRKIDWENEKDKYSFILQSHVSDILYYSLLVLSLIWVCAHSDILPLFLTLCSCPLTIWLIFKFYSSFVTYRSSLLIHVCLANRNSLILLLFHPFFPLLLYPLLYLLMSSSSCCSTLSLCILHCDSYCFKSTFSLRYWSKGLKQLYNCKIL